MGARVQNMLASTDRTFVLHRRRTAFVTRRAELTARVGRSKPAFITGFQTLAEGVGQIRCDQRRGELVRSTRRAERERVHERLAHSARLSVFVTPRGFLASGSGCCSDGGS